MKEGDPYTPALPFHTYTVSAVEKLFGVENDKGLTLNEEQLAAGLLKYGPNELGGQSRVSWVKILFEQLFNAMTLVLIVATILSFVFADYAEAVVLLIVIITNTAIGFSQEYKAEQTMESLRKMSTPTARVLRNCGEICIIPSKDVIPGDIVLFEEGDVVPADARLIECFQLNVDEALLTGESVPVAKK